MARAELTPLEIKYKKTISSKLNELLNLKHAKKADINKATKIPSSTLTDYFKGRSLPSPENVEKLAKFFNVDKSEIDPRFSTSNEKQSVTDNDLDKMLDSARSFDGKPMSNHDREIIRAYLKGLYSGK